MINPDQESGSHGTARDVIIKPILNAGQLVTVARIEVNLNDRGEFVRCLTVKSLYLIEQIIEFKLLIKWAMLAWSIPKTIVQYSTDQRV